MAEALSGLGVEHAMVVHGEDGLDEISLAAPTRVAEVRGGVVSEFEVCPHDFGFAPGTTEDLTVTDPAHATEVLRRTLAGDGGPAQDVLALNAAAALYVGGRASSLKEGVVFARDILRSGTALKVIERMRLASHGDVS
jgi:anthranilate phosphoribosyltransferase